MTVSRALPEINLFISTLNITGSPKDMYDQMIKMKNFRVKKINTQFNEVKVQMSKFK